MRTWKYLQTEPYDARYVLAAWVVRDCPSVVEICGCRIHEFLSSRPIVEVDPGATLEVPAPVVQVRARFQEASFDGLDGYGLVIIGMDFEVDRQSDGTPIYGLLPEGEIARLADVVARAQVSVIEFAANYEPARYTYSRILPLARVRKRFSLILDLSQNDPGDLSNSYPPFPLRELTVLEPA